MQLTNDIMREIPDLAPSKGRAVTLQVPVGIHVDDSLYEAVARSLRSACSMVEIAKPPESSWLGLFLRRHRMVAEWLAFRGGTSMEVAQKTIRSFPIQVHPRIDYNAMNPRRFLAWAAARARRPNAIVYATDGMDPNGRRALHQYVTTQRSDLFVVHVSWNCPHEPTDDDLDYLASSERIWLTRP